MKQRQGWGYWMNEMKTTTKMFFSQLDFPSDVLVRIGIELPSRILCLLFFLTNSNESLLS